MVCGRAQSARASDDAHLASMSHLEQEQHWLCHVASTPYDPSNPEHFDLLRELWVSSGLGLAGTLQCTARVLHCTTYAALPYGVLRGLKMCSPYGIDSSSNPSPTASAATSAASPSRQNRFPIRERRSYCRRASGYRGTCGLRSPRRASGAMRPTLGAELVDGDVRDEPRGLEGFARHRAGRVRGQPRLNRGALVGVAVDRAV